MSNQTDHGGSQLTWYEGRKCLELFNICQMSKLVNCRNVLSWRRVKHLRSFNYDFVTLIIKKSVPAKLTSDIHTAIE